MSRAVDVSKLTGLESRFAAFVAERHPLALPLAVDALSAARKSSGAGADSRGIADSKAIEGLRQPFRRELAKRLYDVMTAPEGIDETTPGVTAIRRLEVARQYLDQVSAQWDAAAARLKAFVENDERPASTTRR